MQAKLQRIISRQMKGIRSIQQQRTVNLMNLMLQKTSRAENINKQPDIRKNIAS